MSFNNPTISIIMPVYNGAEFLVKSIDSIVAQTFTDWELIIIDDSSTDQSRAIIEQYVSCEPRILVFQNTEVKGLAGALNCGLCHARGIYIARADADDINVPERLQIEYDYLQAHSEIDIVGSWYKTFGNNKKPKVRKHPSSTVVIAWKYLSNTYFCHPTVMFRKKVLGTIAHYPIVVSEDFAFLSQIIHIHKGYNIQKVLLHYREHSTNYSSIKATAIKESVFETYKKNYTFYSGNRNIIDAFYRFHAQYRLSLTTLFPLIQQSLSIGKGILKHYHLQKNIWAHIVLYGTIKIHFLKGITYSIIRNILSK